MEIQKIIDALENLAPRALQEDYDNAGLLSGNGKQHIIKALICLDITETVLDEAIRVNAGLIISHHPLIFKGLKKITGASYIERILIKAIRHDIAIFAVHTNLDNVKNGVSSRICEKLGLKDYHILQPKKNLLKKLQTYCPDIKLADGSYVPETVRKALFEAGAGHIGNYDSCSFSAAGTGTYRGLENTNQFIGTKYEITSQKEIRIETVFPAYLQNNVISALLKNHPYEEVAYDIFPMDNLYDEAGSGMIGTLPAPMEEKDFLKFVKARLETEMLRHSPLKGKQISRVAFCGGAGSFLIHDAISKGADAYVTADLKYHDFFESEEGILLVDAGHYETEQFTINLLHEYLTNIFPNFAFQKIGFKNNPINYL